MHYILFASLIFLSVNICGSQDPLFFMKNKSDRGIYVQLIAYAHKAPADLFNEQLIDPDGEFIIKKSTNIKPQDIQGLRIQYTPENIAWDNQTPKNLYTKTYKATFNPSYAQKYFLKLTIDKADEPILEPQKGILGKTSDFKYSLSNNIKNDDIEVRAYDEADTPAQPSAPKPALPKPTQEKKSIESKYKEGSTQSEAHLSVPVIYREVERIYNFSKDAYYQQLYNQVISRERENNDCFVFYNAFSNEWRVPQDLYLALYIAVNPLSTRIENFRAFRWIPVTHQTPKEYLKNELINHGMVNDNEFRVKTNLLSANLALFGNVGFFGECTFEYFLNAKSNTELSDDIFKTILDLFDNPKTYKAHETPLLYKYIPRIKNLAKLLKSQPLPNKKMPQSLSQIFIPKTIVDNVGYISWVQGIPYEEKLVNWIEVEAKPGLKSNPTYNFSAPKITAIRELFKNEKDTHPLFASILDGIEKGKYRLSTILEEYIKTPQLVPGLNNLQARLIMTPEYMGNPTSGVKVYLYDRISPQDKAKYESELDTIVKEIRNDFLTVLREKRNRDIGVTTE